MYSGDVFKQEGTSKDGEEDGLPRDLPPVYVKKVASSGEPHMGFNITSSESPPSTKGFGQQRQPSKPHPSDITNATSSESKVAVHFRDAELSRDLLAAVHADQDSTNATQARQLNGFFTVLSLCHTVLASVDRNTGKMEYKAQSPDEAALVQAAADMGFVFKGRDKEVLLLQTPFGSANVGAPAEDENEIITRKSRPSSSGSTVDAEVGLERYELLNILEFTSARKRMSVVVRKLDGDDSRLFLLSKGADNVIFERLKPGAGEELKNVTETHLDELASQGLRTLTLAYKVIGGELFSIVNFWRLNLFIFHCRGRV